MSRDLSTGRDRVITTRTTYHERQKCSLLDGSNCASDTTSGGICVAENKLIFAPARLCAISHDKKIAMPLCSDRESPCGTSNRPKAREEAGTASGVKYVWSSVPENPVWSSRAQRPLLGVLGERESATWRSVK